MISVIVVTKGERFNNLFYCLASLQHQTFTDCEIIVVYPSNVKNDKLIATGNFREINQTGQGIGNARNCGVAAAKGEVIVFTDDDCVTPPDWLEKINNAFQQHPELGYIGGEFTVHKSNNIWLKWIDLRNHSSPKNTSLGYAQGCNMAYRSEIFKKFKFDETVTFGYDEQDLQNRLHSACLKSLVFPDIVVEHNHRSNFKDFTKMRVGYAKGKVQIYKKQGRELFNWSDLLNLGFFISLFYATLTVGVYHNPTLYLLSVMFFLFAMQRQAGSNEGIKIFLIDVYVAWLWTFSKMYYSLRGKM